MITDRYLKDTTWGDVEHQGLSAAYVITKIRNEWKFYTALSHGCLPYYGTCNEPTWRTTMQLLQDKTLHRYATPSGRYRIMSARGEQFRWLPVTFATVNYEHAKTIIRSLTELEGKSDDLLHQMDSIAEMYG